MRTSLSRFAAFAAKAFGSLAFMGRMSIMGPFFPPDVQFFHEESPLCQLQSRFRRGLSIVSPTVGDDFLVSRQNSCDLFQFVDRGAKRAGDVPGREGLSAACVQKDEVELSIFDCMQNGRAGFFSVQFVSEVIAISANLIFSKSHVFLQFLHFKRSPADSPVILCRL